MENRYPNDFGYWPTDGSAIQTWEHWSRSIHVKFRWSKTNHNTANRPPLFHPKLYAVNIIKNKADENSQVVDI